MSAAVHEKSAAPCPTPVRAEKYSENPPPRHHLEGAAPELGPRQVGRPGSAQPFDDHPVRVHPGRALPVALASWYSGASSGTLGTGKFGQYPAGLAEQLEQAAARVVRRWTPGPQREERGDGRTGHELTGDRVARAVLAGTVRARAASSASGATCHRRQQGRGQVLAELGRDPAPSARLAAASIALNATSSIRTARSSAGMRRSSKP